MLSGQASGQNPISLYFSVAGKRSAKPLFGGSIPPRASNNLQKNKELYRRRGLTAFARNGLKGGQFARFGGQIGGQADIFARSLSIGRV